MYIMNGKTSSMVAVAQNDLIIAKMWSDQDTSNIVNTVFLPWYIHNGSPEI